MKDKIKTFDQFLNSFPEDTKEVILKLTEIIKDELPDIQISMKWGKPVFQRNGYDIIGFAVQKYYYSIYLWNMSWTKKYKKSIKKISMGKGCVRFKELEHIPEKMLRDMIKINGNRT